MGIFVLIAMAIVVYVMVKKDPFDDNKPAV